MAAADQHLPTTDRAMALALLRLQAEWGADEALSEIAIDRRRVETLPIRPPAGGTGADPAARPSAPVAPAAPHGRGQAARALAIASGAADLDALQAALDGFDDFALRSSAAHTVRVVLGAHPRLIVVGEVANADEDRSGQPFAGPLGQQLDRLLSAIGLSRDDCALMPAIPWRPPGERAPTTSEIAVCTPLLLRRIELAASAIGAGATLLLLGKLPLRMVEPDAATERSRNGTARPLSVLRSHAPALEGIALSHPTMIAAQPGLRRATWHGLLGLRERLRSDRN